MPNLDEARSTPRFVSHDVVAAMFVAGSSTISVSLRDVSVNGAQIEHAQAVRPGLHGRIVLSTLTVDATVIWTRLTAPGSYRSGLRIEERLEIVATAIRDLLARGVVRKGEDTLRRRDQARLERTRRFASLGDPLTVPSSTDVQRVREAREWILMFPEDALKWYNRARITATEDHLRVAGSGRANREDVLAVWEYLGRAIDLADVVRALD